MTRDEIYDHLAQVYLGKKRQTQEPPPRQISTWLVINMMITVVIFATSVYGLTAFLARRGDLLEQRVIYALNKGPIRVPYDVRQPYPQVKTFSLPVTGVDAGKFGRLQFAVRASEGGSPGVIRIEVRNQRHEVSSRIIDGIGHQWRQRSIAFEDFAEISDWSTVSEIHFIIEAWNADKKKGAVLIDDICFSS